MQLKHALLPIAVLAGSGIFLAKRQFAATEKRNRMAIFQDTIRTVHQHRTEMQAVAAKAAKDNAKAPGTETAEPVNRTSIDLKGLAKSLAAMDKGGVPDMQALFKIQKSILDLPPEDLSALVADAARLDVPENQKNSLIMMLMQGLAQKNPKAAVLVGQSLLQEASPEQRQMRMGGMQTAFSQWADQDPDAARQWYDAELAAGRFENRRLDSTDPLRTVFEAALLPGLAVKNPTAAKDRLLAMPEPQRLEVLSNSRDFGEDAASQKLFASLARGTLKDDQKTRALANMAAGIQHGRELKDVSEFLTNVSATPEEKTRILPEVAGFRLRSLVWESDEPLTVKGIAPLRDWMEQEQRGSSAKSLGESLASVAGSGKFDQAKAVALVTALYDSSPSDELVSTFIAGSRAQENPGLYRPLAEKIQDPSQRAKVLDILSPKP
ncbi:MAG: hypothetical protein JWM59_2207 [Verrucomicrobiales bacterium]|nr:hypothetical protein [Verrucomicrobiales bacterium]